MLPTHPFRVSAVAVFAVLAAGLAASAQPSGQGRAGYLGILLSPPEQGGTGIMIRDVTPDSPAAKAGLKMGDHIIKWGDEEARDVGKFLRDVASKKPGDKVALVVLREGKDQSLSVTLGERPSPDALPGELPGTRRPAILGVQTRPLTPDLKERLKVTSETGAVVSVVMPDSPAFKAGLREDDVITAVDNQNVKTAEELRDAIQKAGPGKEVSLQVLRGKDKLSIKATLQEGAAEQLLLPGPDRMTPPDVESLFNQDRKIRELERKIQDLENRLRALEKK